VIRVALDAMGGDGAPGPEVAGAARALRELESDFQVTFVGRQDAIEQELQRYPGIDRDRVRVVHADDVVTMSDKPLAAVRKKPNSSLVVGLNLHRAKEVDAFISAGNTGATLAGSTILLGLHDNVDRATVASPFPRVGGSVLVVDAGANVDCTSRELVNFARLGAVYMRDLMGVAHPKVGLLNLGEEDEKGSAVVRETHQLLTQQARLNFVGNIEGRDIVVPHPVHGQIDVVVCDGFVGNVVLKFYESIGALVTMVLQRDAPDMLMSPGLKPLMQFLDYGEYGGAPLLGVRGVSIVAHGASSANAIMNAIRRAVVSVRSGLSEHTAAEMALHQTAPAR
jgi:glycerol-3-phosphate acyltransferase PlsX